VSALRFRAAIAIRGINPYVPVSARRASRLRPGWRKPMPVCVTVNGESSVPWRINLMPAGDGSFFLYLHGNVRKAAGVDVGDVVDVSLMFDEKYRGGPAGRPPAWFARELKENRSATQGWKRLPPSRKKEIVRYLSRLKSADAKQRNTQLALHVLAGGSGRFMARSWNSG
jgi:hypothetical protein